jgi:hypothetical protein
MRNQGEKSAKIAPSVHVRRLRPKLAAGDLSRGIAGDGINDANVAGLFKARQLGSQILVQLVLAEVTTAARYDERRESLPVVGVGDAHDRTANSVSHTTVVIA